MCSLINPCCFQVQVQANCLRNIWMTQWHSLNIIVFACTDKIRSFRKIFNKETFVDKECICCCFLKQVTMTECLHEVDSNLWYHQICYVFNHDNVYFPRITVHFKGRTKRYTHLFRSHGRTTYCYLATPTLSTEKDAKFLNLSYDCFLTTCSGNKRWY